MPMSGMRIQRHITPTTTAVSAHGSTTVDRKNDRNRTGSFRARARARPSTRMSARDPTRNKTVLSRARSASESRASST